MFRLIVPVLLLAACLPLTATAQDKDDGLKVVRSIVNAEQDSPELCLEFNHPLDSDRRRLLASIRLEAGSDTVNLQQRNLNVIAPYLCLEALSHDHDYHLSINGLRAGDGKKLAEAYSLSFTIPNRRPMLAFDSDALGDGLLRFRGHDPVLRAVNVGDTTVTLYRMADAQQMAAAFGQRLQTVLAPSESTVFAATNNQPLWRDDMVLDDTDGDANKNITATINLQKAGALKPGLYFLTVAATEKNKKTSASLTPMAALWFTISDLKLVTVRNADGFYLRTQKADASGVMAAAHITVYDRNQQILAETVTDQNGLAFVPMEQGKQASVATIMAVDDAGDVDLNDMTTPLTYVPAAENQKTYTLPAFLAQIMMDRDFYQPGQTVQLQLNARNSHGEQWPIDGSKILLLRPDHSIAEQWNVPKDSEGVATLAIRAPAVNGVWPLVWQQVDGGILAQQNLRVTTNTDAPHGELSADQAIVGRDGKINLTIKTLTAANKPAGFLSGKIMAQWQATATPFANWADYVFGSAGAGDNSQPQQVAAFLTDGSGMAQVPVTLPPPVGFRTAPTVNLRVVMDRNMGATEPKALLLQQQPDSTSIGIKPVMPEGRFAENNLARFSIIAIDSDGKRKAVPDLNYQIYEEGRNFAWYQADGRWNYRPRLQHRRIGSGTLSLRNNGDDVIDWPVTAGAYALDITDSAGAVLAHYDFEAGWGWSQNPKPKMAALHLKSSLPVLAVNQPAHIHFMLDRPALVSAFIGDEHIRQTVQQAFPAGDNVIDITPNEAWGQNILISIEAQAMTDTAIMAAGQLTLPVQHDRLMLTLTPDVPDHLTVGTAPSLPLTVGNRLPQQRNFTSMMAVPDSKDGATLMVFGVPLAADGKAVLPLDTAGFGTNFSGSFSGKARLVFSAWNANQYGQQDITVPVRPVFAVTAALPAVLQKDDLWQAQIELANNDLTGGLYHYSLSVDASLRLTGNGKGAVTLAHGQKGSIPLSLRAAQAGTGTIRLDITGPDHFHLQKLWIVAVAGRGAIDFNADEQRLERKQVWSMAASGKNKSNAAWLIVGLRPVNGAAGALAAFLSAVPQTSSELASWIEAALLWRKALEQFHLADFNLVTQRSDAMLARLLQRQNSDGGFPASAAGGASDLASTASALEVMMAAGRPAEDINLAAGWLQRKLDNAWFDESERAVRARGFAALAASNQLDIAPLRYFAETSIDKNLPVDAMAQLALALGKGGDRDKELFWRSAALQHLADSNNSVYAVMQAVLSLAANPNLDPALIDAPLQKIADDLGRNNNADPETLAGFLHALWLSNDRAGLWHLAINNQDRSASGIAVIPVPEKHDAISLRNPGDRPLFVAKAELAKSSDSGESAAQTIFNMNGTAVPAGAALTKGETYLIMREGIKQGNFSLHQEANAFLQVIGCAVEGGDQQAPWAWLNALSLSPLESCEASNGALDLALVPDARGAWRYAYLAKAQQAGIFTLDDLTARSPATNARSRFVSGEKVRVE